MPPVFDIATVSRSLAVAGLLALSMGPCHAAGSPKLLDDTGMTRCAVFSGQKNDWVFTRKCQATGQDAAYGRDATDASAKDGAAGFSFAKIGEDGTRLPREAAAWRCVLDRTTGLEWEVKTDDGSVFDYRRTFTYVGNGHKDDASGLVQAANAAGLCGQHDWRLPSRLELESLVDFGLVGAAPLVDGDWFPRSAPSMHWTATSATVNGGGQGYWWAVNFATGDSLWRGGQYDADAVRLVRRAEADPQPRFKPRGDAASEVLDRRTNLVWRRCAEGRTWTGSSCAGSGTIFLTHDDATAHALDEARRTGQAWRVPNIKELSSLVDTRVAYPAIDPQAFPGLESDRYHSGTIWLANAAYSWRVAFGDGQVTTDFWGGRMLLVRDASAR